jgi:hypothetical protein
MCLLREVKDDAADDATAAAPGSAAADARVLPERRRAKPSRRHKIAAPKSDETAVENNSTATIGFRHFRGRVTGHCRCELGWTGRDCSQPHAEVCANVNKCSIFNAQQDAVSVAKAHSMQQRARKHNCTQAIRASVILTASFCLFAAVSHVTGRHVPVRL